MKEALLSLSPTELQTLAAGLRSGRLCSPYSASTLVRYLPVALAAPVSAHLQELADTGMQPAAAAYTLELIASARSESSSIGDFVDLVLTGPQVGGAEHRDTSVVVSDLFRKAENVILVAGYAVYQGQKVFHALATRMVERPTLKVRMFLDIQRSPSDTSSSTEIVRRFTHRFQSDQWPSGKPSPEVFYDPRALSTERSTRAALHAKCVVADGRHVFVSSANFTEAAQERNVEVGLLLHSASIAGNLTRFFDTLCESGKFARAL
jgi:hypothetical protein